MSDIALLEIAEAVWCVWVCVCSGFVLVCVGGFVCVFACGCGCVCWWVFVGTARARHVHGMLWERNGHSMRTAWSRHGHGMRKVICTAWQGNGMGPACWVWIGVNISVFPLILVNPFTTRAI